MRKRLGTEARRHIDDRSVGLWLLLAALLTGCAVTTGHGAENPAGAGGAAARETRGTEVQFPNPGLVPEPVRTAAGTGLDPYLAWAATTARLSAWAALAPSSIDHIPMPIPASHGEGAPRVRRMIELARLGELRETPRGTEVAPLDLYLQGVSAFARKDFARAADCWEDMLHDGTSPELRAAARFAREVARANDLTGAGSTVLGWIAAFDGAISGAKDLGLVDAATAVKLLSLGRAWVVDPRPIQVHWALPEAPEDRTVRRFVAAMRAHQGARGGGVSTEEASTLLVLLR